MSTQRHPVILVMNWTGVISCFAITKSRILQKPWRIIQRLPRGDLRSAVCTLSRSIMWTFSFHFSLVTSVRTGLMNVLGKRLSTERLCAAARKTGLWVASGHRTLYNEFTSTLERLCETRICWGREIDMMSTLDHARFDKWPHLLVQLRFNQCSCLSLFARSDQFM